MVFQDLLGHSQLPSHAEASVAVRWLLPLKLVIDLGILQNQGHGSSSKFQRGKSSSVKQDLSPSELTLRVVCEAVRPSLLHRAEEGREAKNIGHLRNKATGGEQNQPNRKVCGMQSARLPVRSGSTITPYALNAGHRI